MKPLILSLLGMFLFTASINSQTFFEDLSSAEMESIEKPAPSFKAYSDNSGDFVYIELNDADPYSSYRYVIYNSDRQPRQRGLLSSAFTGKIVTKSLKTGSYTIGVFDEAGILLQEEKTIRKE